MKIFSVGGWGQKKCAVGLPLRVMTQPHSSFLHSVGTYGVHPPKRPKKPLHKQIDRLSMDKVVAVLCIFCSDSAMIPNSNSLDVWLTL